LTYFYVPKGKGRDNPCLYFLRRFLKLNLPVPKQAKPKNPHPSGKKKGEIL